MNKISLSGMKMKFVSKSQSLVWFVSKSEQHTETSNLKTVKIPILKICQRYKITFYMLQVMPRKTIFDRIH